MYMYITTVTISFFVLYKYAAVNDLLEFNLRSYCGSAIFNISERTRRNPSLGLANTSTQFLLSIKYAHTSAEIFRITIGVLPSVATFPYENVASDFSLVKR